MGAFFLVAYIVIGIAQVWAGIEGMQLTFGIGGFLAVVLLLVAYAIPFVGTAGGVPDLLRRPLRLVVDVVAGAHACCAGHHPHACRGCCGWSGDLGATPARAHSVAPSSRNADGKDGRPRAQSKTASSKPAARAALILRELYVGGCGLQTHVF